MKRKYFVIISIVCVLLLSVFLLFENNKKVEKQLTIDEILETDSYKILSTNVKRFIKNYYEENGVVLLTEDIAKPGEEYINPNYIDYLDSEDKESIELIPSVTAYTPVLVGSNKSLPSKFDLRNVDGKNFVTPNKNQGSEGLCWAYGTASLLETHDLIAKDKSYDKTAVLFSEKQIDYATSKDGIIGGNKLFANINRTLSTGGFGSIAFEVLKERVGGFQDTWNTENRMAIYKNLPLRPSVVFDSTRALYEADETVELSNIAQDKNDKEYFDKMNNTIKELIYNNGGAVISLRVSGNYFANYSFSDTDTIMITNRNYITTSFTGHLLHLIGWDDDYEYEFCYGDVGGTKGKVVDSVKYNDPEHGCDYYWGKKLTKASGKGAWIMKNSWGPIYSYVYLPYDSYIVAIDTITKYADTKDWDVSTKLTRKTNWSGDKVNYYYNINNHAIVGDSIVKLKVDGSQTKFNLYYSEDGTDDNLTFIGEYSYDLNGTKTIDLKDKNIKIKEKSYFRTDEYTDIILFTKNSSSEEYAYTEDYIYSSEKDYPTNNNYLDFELQTYVKNIDTGTNITYKLKNSKGEYISEKGYTIENTKVYYNMVTPSIRIYETYAKKGTITLETWNGSKLLTTSSIIFKQDFISMKGSGTNSDPWQITNARQFNMIRNANKDNFVLMNDIDFEYDTQNEDGALYNDGKGFKAIEIFYGNLNGNGKTIKNIYADQGLFHIFQVNEACPLNECGIHDLTVDNLRRDHCYYSSGGIINMARIYYNTNVNLSNLAFINSDITMTKDNSNVQTLMGLYFGGIVGELDVMKTKETDPTVTISIDNWYTDFSLKVESEPVITTWKNYYFGGLIGAFYTDKEPNVSINNSKVNFTYSINEADHVSYRLSDLIGQINSVPKNLFVNNFIGNVIKEKDVNFKVYTNAFVYYIASSLKDFVYEVNNAKSTLGYNYNTGLNLSNSETGLTSYELAKANYDKLTYYEKNKVSYKDEVEGSTKVEFKDRFNIEEGLIPTIKKYNETYSTYHDEITIKIGESKTVEDLIKTDSGHHNVKIYTSLECRYDICKNKTDESIISIQDNNKFTGKKDGKATLFIVDDISGYLGIVNVTVIRGDAYTLTLDYNYDDITDNTRIVIKNNKYGELPVLERESYSFLGWFTNKEKGTEVKEDTIFTGNKDTTLYAHWKLETVTYKVTFNTDGGSTIPEQSVKYNGKATVPNVPLRKGYVFKEWQLNGVKYDFELKVKENITLTATWITNIYTITFDSNGGTSVANQYVEYNDKIKIPDNPTRTGYTFKEWQYKGVKYDFNTAVDDHITLIAVWTEDESELSLAIKNSGYKINNGLVSGFNLGDTVDKAKAKFGDKDIKISSKSDVIGTGTEISKGTAKFTVVIKGDITGDGKIDSDDVNQMKKYLYEEVTLTEPFKQAGLIESSNEIKSIDLLRMQQHLLGDYIIK